MSKTIKILHIDPDFKVTYLIYGPGSSIRTPVPLETAIDLLKKVDFDLILSEPHNKAILKKEKPENGIKRIKSDLQPFMEASQWRSQSKYGQIDIPVRRIGQGNRTVSTMDRPKKKSRINS